MSIVHFGINIKEKESNHINKNTYLSAKPEGMQGWTDKHYAKQIVKADINYDANMAYFNSLDYDEFLNYLEKQCKKFKFIECFDLKELACVEGIYMMVLDNYKQVYIGISQDIKKRIQQHWSKKKSLERLIFGDICNSVLSIDSFGALDTTRIFYIKTSSLYSYEEKIVNKFDSRYTLNRTSGGIGSSETHTDTENSALLAVMANQRKKLLTPFIDINKLKSIVPEDFDYYLKRYPELKEKI